MGHNGSVFSVNIENDDDLNNTNSSSSFSSSKSMEQSNKKQRDASFPEFLANSRVKTAETMIRESFVLSNNNENTYSSNSLIYGERDINKNERSIDDKLDSNNSNAFGVIRDENNDINNNNNNNNVNNNNNKINEEIKSIVHTDENQEEAVEEDDDVDWED